MFGITKSAQETSFCCDFCATGCMQSKVDFQFILAVESFPANLATTCLWFPFISTKSLSVRNKWLWLLLHMGEIHRIWNLFIHPEVEPSFNLRLHERKIRAMEFRSQPPLQKYGKKVSPWTTTCFFCKEKFCKKRSFKNTKTLRKC